MPRKTTRRRTQRGGGKFGDFMKSANNYLKKTKLISKVAGALDFVPGASTVARVGGQLGYGRAVAATTRRMAPRRN